jgi:hypothetical protein
LFQRASHLLIICSLLVVSTANPVMAQPRDWWVQTDSLLQQMELELLLPVETSVKPLRIHENPFQSYQIAFRLPEEKLEMRACLYPSQEAYSELEAPHLRAGRAATSVGRNDPEAVISLFRLSDSYLWEHFGADWGVEYYLEPKPGFSRHRYCKLLSLHKAGAGTVLIFFLFDDPANPAIDDYAAMFRFLK